MSDSDVRAAGILAVRSERFFPSPGVLRELVRPKAVEAASIQERAARDYQRVLRCNTYTPESGGVWSYRQIKSEVGPEAAEALLKEKRMEIIERDRVLDRERELLPVVALVGVGRQEKLIRGVHGPVLQALLDEPFFLRTPAIASRGVFVPEGIIIAGVIAASLDRFDEWGLELLTVLGHQNLLGCDQVGLSAAVSQLARDGDRDVALSAAGRRLDRDKGLAVAEFALGILDGPDLLGPGLFAGGEK
jgi:hypothetical protein